MEIINKEIDGGEARAGLFWQIEHNGSWYYEISDRNS